MKEARMKLLKAAFGLFVARGYRAVSVNDICREAGITKGGFYHHWPSKGEIFSEILLEYYLPEMKRMGSVLPPEGSPVDRLRDCFRVWGESIAEIRNHPDIPQSDFGLYYLFLEGLNYHSGFKAALREHYRDLQKRIGQLLREGMDSGVFRTDLNPEETALAAVAQIEGLGIWLLLGTETDPRTLYEIQGQVFLKTLLPQKK